MNPVEVEITAEEAGEIFEGEAMIGEVAMIGVEVMKGVVIMIGVIGVVMIGVIGVVMIGMIGVVVMIGVIGVVMIGVVMIGVIGVVMIGVIEVVMIGMIVVVVMGGMKIPEVTMPDVINGIPGLLDLQEKNILYPRVRLIQPFYPISLIKLWIKISRIIFMN
jgi:hypothetical protein